MSIMQSRTALAVLGVLSITTLTGFGCLPRDSQNIAQDVKLSMWGLWHESADLASIIAAFEQTTGAIVEYKKIASVAEYEKELLAALAQDRGPDIFVIHQTWVEGRRGFLAPAPTDVIDERIVREEFVDVVADDVVRDGKIYALPVSVDTLALYYNKDILGAAGIATPPRTWDQFQQAVEQLTRITRLGVVQQSGAAIGTAANINRPSDILQLLFLQSGISPADTNALIKEEGVRVLTFYTDFANKSKKVYTWGLQQDYSLDAFAKGNVAMTFNYSYHMPTMRAKNPQLRFAIAPMPQISDSKIINFASYWPYAISNKSKNTQVAWQFLRYLTSKESSEKINAVQKAPPARRDGIAALARDPVLGVFTEQTLTAVTWPRADIVATDTVLNTMIDSVVTGAATPPEALRRAADQLKQIQARSAPKASTQPSAPQADPQLNVGFF